MNFRKRGCLLTLCVMIGLLVFWSVTARVNPFKVLLFNRQIRFVGRVVDQFGQPVPRARITIQFGQAVPIGMYQRVTEDVYTTNNKGYFSIRWRVGIGLLVTKIEKKGYEFSEEGNTQPTSWNYIQPRGPAPSWDAPAVFHMRKRGETAHILSQQFTFGFKVKNSGVEYGFDLIRFDDISPRDIKKPSINGEPLCCDLLYKGIWNATDRAWTLVFSSGTPGGGVIISDQCFYVAPETGYQPSVTLAPMGELSRQKRWPFEKDRYQHPGPRYLYVRSRAPYVYARIDLGEDFDVNDRPFVQRTETHLENCFFQLACKYVINPYGDRILDDEPDLPGDTRLKLNEEVRKAYRFNVNGRPPKPDISKLVRTSIWW